MRQTAILLAMIVAAGASAFAAPDGETVSLRFSMMQDPAVYEESDYGEPPQIAIWLEDPDTGERRTVYVTYRTATGDFIGKVDCPVSLPAWVMVWREETGNDGHPTPRQTAPDAVTAATTLDRRINAAATGIPEGKRLVYYIEMNVAADFNEAFPVDGPGGQLDYQHNGQPSLIYRGEITAEPGNTSTPEPWARTAQFRFTGELIHDLQGMDSALRCLTDIEVTCTEN